MNSGDLARKYTPDYTYNFKSAEMLCRKIRRYWYEQRRRDFIIRVERLYLADENGEPTLPYYVIRSNIKYVVPNEFRTPV